MARPSTYTNDSAPSVRNLKLLVVLLAISNILVGAVSVFLLRGVDQRYSDLINHTVPALNELRELMADSLTTMRSTNPFLVNAPGADRAALIVTMRASLATEQKFRTSFLAGAGLNETGVNRAALQKLGAEFERGVSRVIELYAAGKVDEAGRAREELLRPAFEQLLTGIGAAADNLQSLGMTANKNFTSKTNTLSAIVISVASWPVLALVGLLLLTAVFVIIMMIAFRGKDLVDAP